MQGSNQVWTFDWKGWFCSGDGAKIEPLTIRDLGSRYLLWVLPVARRHEAAVRRVCLRLFRTYGCPKVIRTDQGSPFWAGGPYGLTTLSLWWYRLGIRVEFVSRRHRIDNNAHEQMHRVMKQETAKPPACSRSAQLARLRRWQHYYNYARPHAALGHQPPGKRYRPRPSKLPALLEPTYPPTWLVRTVHLHGDIYLGGQRHYVGRAFAGLCVGCKPLEEGHLVYFHRLRLTSIAPQSLR